MGSETQGTRWDFARSVSQRRMYRDCGKKYELKYGAGWNTKTTKAQYKFGNAVEEVCNGVVQGVVTTDEQAQARFVELWEPYRMDPTITYSSKVNYGILMERGKILVCKAMDGIKKHLCLDKGTFQLQRRIDFQLGDSREMGYLDFHGYARKEVSDPWVSAIIDFKTGPKNDPEHVGELDEQLTSYQVGIELENPDIKIKLLCLFRMIWTTEPKLQLLWYPRRSELLVTEFKKAAADIDESIKAGKFNMNERACHTWGGCYFQPLCFNSQAGRLQGELERNQRKVLTDAEDVEW